LKQTKNISLFIILATLILIILGYNNLIEGKDLEALRQCSAKLENNVLTIENNLISRSYSWNNGNLITLNIKIRKKISSGILKTSFRIVFSLMLM